MTRRSVPRAAGRALRTALAGGGAMATWAAVSPAACFTCACMCMRLPRNMLVAQCGGFVRDQKQRAERTLRAGTCHGTGKSVCRSCHGGGTAVPIAAKAVKRWVLQQALVVLHVLQHFYTALQLQGKMLLQKYTKKMY